MKIENNDLYIRNADVDDCAQLAKWWNDGGVMAHAGFPNGLGRVILSMLIKKLFSMGYTKIVLDTNLKNGRAKHVYELLGFQKVRVNENSWTNQVGELQSSVDYELVPNNFIDWSR